MLDLTKQDKSFIDTKYKLFLQNIKQFLEQFETSEALDYPKIIINMLHQGLFSIDNSIIFSSTYNYISLPSLISSGAQVTCGVCCCRHVSALLQDIFCILGLNSSYLYVKINDENAWQVVAPNKANHVVVLLTINNHEYIIDPRNRLILLKDPNGSLTNISAEPLSRPLDYEDSNITEIAKTLKKYYTYRNLGIQHVFDYD